MAVTSFQSLEIEAPVARVWDVIIDLPHYADWNAFVPRVESSLRPGEPIVMHVHVFNAFAQRQKETVFENVEQKRLCYGVQVPAGALRSRRCHHLEAAGKDSTHYRSEFELSGWLSPVVSALLGSRLHRGFERMAEGLKRRAEKLACDPSRSHPPNHSGEPK